VVIVNIFFDMGNTLVHRSMERQLGFAAVLRDLGYDLSDDEMLEAYRNASSSMPPEGVYKKSLEEINQRLLMKLTLTMQNLGLPSPGIVAERLLSTDFNPIKLYPDALPALEAARARGYRLGIISNWDPGLMSFCRKLGIQDYFDTIIASRAAGYRKPNPEIFLIALASMAARPEESIHVGDSFGSDAIGAMGAGIQPVIIDRGGRSTSTFCPVIRSLQELVPMVESMNSSGLTYSDRFLR